MEKVTFSQALHAARTGQTVKRAVELEPAKEAVVGVDPDDETRTVEIVPAAPAVFKDIIVRFLTKEEAAPILLERSPCRRTAQDGLAVEEYAPDIDPRHLGLFVIGEDTHIEFRPSEEDTKAEWEIIQNKNEEITSDESLTVNSDA